MLPVFRACQAAPLCAGSPRPTAHGAAGPATSPPRAHRPLTWCALGEARLLDDSELGLRGAGLGLQGRRGPFPGQALGRLGAAGVSGQHSRVVRRGRGTSVSSKRRQGIFKGQALTQLPCSSNVYFAKKGCHLSSANRLHFPKSSFFCECQRQMRTLSGARPAVPGPPRAGHRCCGPRGTGCPLSAPVHSQAAGAGRVRAGAGLGLKLRAFHLFKNSTY